MPPLHPQDPELIAPGGSQVFLCPPGLSFHDWDKLRRRDVTRTLIDFPAKFIFIIWDSAFQVPYTLLDLLVGCQRWNFIRAHRDSPYTFGWGSDWTLGRDIQDRALSFLGLALLATKRLGSVWIKQYWLTWNNTVKNLYVLARLTQLQLKSCFPNKSSCISSHPPWHRESKTARS